MYHLEEMPSFDLEELSYVLGGVLTGIVGPKVLKNFGMLVGSNAVVYYGQVHTKKMNSYVHTLGMPIFIYGMLIALPLLLTDDKEKATGLQSFLFTSYMTHYIYLDPRVGAITTIVYSVPLVAARNKVIAFYEKECSPLALRKRINSGDFKSAVMLSTVVMFLQETVGHALAGDPASRIEGIPNAILYAIFYSISHI